MLQMMYPFNQHYFSTTFINLFFCYLNNESKTELPESKSTLICINLTFIPILFLHYFIVLCDYLAISIIHPDFAQLYRRTLR